MALRQVATTLSSINTGHHDPKRSWASANFWIGRLLLSPSAITQRPSLPIIRLAYVGRLSMGSVSEQECSRKDPHEAQHGAGSWSRSSGHQDFGVELSHSSTEMAKRNPTSRDLRSYHRLSSAQRRQTDRRPLTSERLSAIVAPLAMPARNFSRYL